MKKLKQNKKETTDVVSLKNQITATASFGPTEGGKGTTISLEFTFPEKWSNKKIEKETKKINSRLRSLIGETINGSKILDVITPLN
ncbi:MAG: hypothetical protein NTZ44_03815 [Candidatus Nomurabacteria bacterium]|nr:hypothetical protein [Candidatus Nomurabacteria bacterium]